MMLWLWMMLWNEIGITPLVHVPRGAAKSRIANWSDSVVNLIYICGQCIVHHHENVVQNDYPNMSYSYTAFNYSLLVGVLK